MKLYSRAQRKPFCLALLFIGLLSMVIGFVWHQYLTEDAHALQRAAGFLSGLGTGLTLLGAILLFRLRFISPEKIKQAEIEQNDERNIQIRRMAFTISSNVATALFAVLGFALLLMDYPVPSALCIGAMYVQFIVLFISSFVIRRRI